MIYLEPYLYELNLLKIILISHLAKNILLFRTELIKSLITDGHSVIVICPKDLDCEKFSGLGAEFEPWVFSRKSTIWNALLALKQLIFLFKKHQPDRVVAYMIQPILMANLACLFAKLHLTSVFTGLGTLFIQKTKWLHRVRFFIVCSILKQLLKQSQSVVVLNTDDYAELQKLNLSQAPQLQLLPGEGIDLDRFESQNLRQDRIDIYRNTLKQNQQKVILYLGRFIAEKGILDFQFIAKSLHSRSDLHFVAVGELDFGNPSSLTQNQLIQLKKVATVFDWIDDVAELLSVVDLLVYPSQREGFPVGLMEAMASGVPVVAYDVPGVRDALKNHKESLLANKDDICEHIQSFDTKRIDRLNWQKSALDFDQRRIIDFFRGILVDNNTPPTVHSR